MDIFPSSFRTRRGSAPVSQEKDKFGASEKAQIRKETHPTFFESQCLQAADSQDFGVWVARLEVNSEGLG